MPPMTCRTRYAAIAVLVAIVATVARPAAAQTNGSITGTVLDERGAKLRRISVTVRNRTTSDEEQDISGPDGTFSVSNLPPGVYDVLVTDPGFVPFKQEVTVVP